VTVKVELSAADSTLRGGKTLAFRPDTPLMGSPRVLSGHLSHDRRAPDLLPATLVGVGHLTADEWRWLGFHPLQQIIVALGAGVVALADSHEIRC
jgi:hypothetical protein